MVLYVLTLFAIVAGVAVVLGAVFWVMTSVGLQEADDPDESSPEDLTEFEKRHTDRPDVHP